MRFNTYLKTCRFRFNRAYLGRGDTYPEIVIIFRISLRQIPGYEPLLVNLQRIRRNRLCEL